MAKSKYKAEEKVHDKLINLLKNHFNEDEMEMKDEEMDSMKPLEKKRLMKHGKNYKEEDSYFDDDEDMYDSEDEDDDYFEEMMGESEDEYEDDDEYEEQPKLSKDKRKHMAIILATKRAGKK